MTQSHRQADIELTEEMIEAGAVEVGTWNLEEDSWEEIAKAVFLAMLRAQLSPRIEAVQPHQ